MTFDKSLKIFLSAIIVFSLLLVGCSDDNDDDNGTTVTIVNEGITGIFSVDGDTKAYYITPESYELTSLFDSRTYSISWNLDHSEVVFSDNYDLYTADPETGTNTQLTSNNTDYQERFPMYLDNDNLIAFTLHIPYEFDGLCTIDPENPSDFDTLFSVGGNAAMENLKPSPSSNYVGYIRTDNNFVYCIDRNTGERLNPLFGTFTYFNWANNSDLLVQVKDSRVVIVDVVSEEVTEIANISGDGIITEAIFSPDDSQIAYVIEYGTDYGEIYLANSDGSGDAQLLLTHEPEGLRISHIAFSHDGSQIVYYAKEIINGYLKIVDVTSGEVETILESCSGVRSLLWN